nr:hypothetical protein [Tanacetum cinerariifolium]
NGNSFKPVAKTTKNDAGTSTTRILGPCTNEEMAQKKNDVKGRSMLLMAPPNENLMTFNQYKDAKTLFATIETRFSGNKATKKTQKTLLKQLYENFIWRNKLDLDTMSLDDLYNNFKIVEQEANQPNGSELMRIDLEQIHEDVLEEMDLKWQLALLSMRAKRFFQKTGKKITINGSDIAGYDKSKENRTRNQETTRKTVNMEDTSSKVMVEIDGAGFDWSYMGDDEAPTNMAFMAFSDSEGHSHRQLEDQGYFDSRYSRYMTRYISYLTDFKELDRGYVAFGGGAKGGKITSKGTIKTGNLDFEDVYFVKELQFNLFSVSQISKNNMYSVDMKNIVPKKDLTCLVAKATNDESMLWHRRLGHINFKNINKLVKDNLVRGLPLKYFENDQTCVACLKRKQHKVSFKSKIQNSISQPLFMLHMDLFGPTSFWCTASVRTLDNGEIELNATVDGQVKTITEASVRRHLKLAGADGISTLPTTKIFEQFALMGGEGPTSPVGTQHTPTVIKTSQQFQNISITFRKTRTKTKRKGIRIPQSNVPTSVADEAITKEMHDGLGRAITTASSLEAE